MKRWRIIIISLVGLSLVTVGYDKYESLIQPENCLVNVGYIDEFQLDSLRRSNFVTKGGVHGIDISLDGQLTGSGRIRIGRGATEVVREYSLQPGRIAIGYHDEWKTNTCFVEFIPDGRTKGKINIITDFIGD